MSGKLCIVGYHQGGTRELRLSHWKWMAFDIVNAHFREQATILSGMRKALRLVEAGVSDVAPLMTDPFPLERIGEAFETAVAKPDAFVKSIVQPDETLSGGSS
jgi:L-iditol 2-dehydrogenase